MTSNDRKSAYRFTALTVGLLVVAMAFGTAAALTDDTGDECTAEIHYQNGSIEEVPATVDGDGVCRPDRDTLVERGYWNTTEGDDGQS